MTRFLRYSRYGMLTCMVGILMIVSCEKPPLIKEPETPSSIKFFKYNPALSFPVNLNETTTFSLKHPDDNLIKNFNLDFKYFIDPDYKQVEYTIEVNVRPDKLSVYPKKQTPLDGFAVLYPLSKADTNSDNWFWDHTGLIRRYDENLDFDIDFYLSDLTDSPDQYYALRIAKNDSIYYGWFKMELTRDSVKFLEYAYSLKNNVQIWPWDN